jgi:hypothetical protein
LWLTAYRWQANDGALATDIMVQITKRKQGVLAAGGACFAGRNVFRQGERDERWTLGV